MYSKKIIYFYNKNFKNYFLSKLTRKFWLMVKYFMHLSDFVICSLHFMSNNGITLVDLRVMKLISDKMLDLVMNLETQVFN